MNEDARTVAGRYRVGERLGRGGMGAVYEAEHLGTGRRVALKMLLPGLGRIPEIARRFEREARATSVLNHPNVVAVLDFGTDDDGGLFLVLERLRGRSLADAMSETRLPQDRVFRIVRQVVEALAHAHAAGVVHRDLKPENIMLVDPEDAADEPDRIKLLDFGIAKLVDDAEAQAGDRLTQAGVAFGTPTYMAPEQALGEEIDARADLYAVGIILYELLAGRAPFTSDDKLAVLRMHVAVDPPPLAETAGERFAPALERFLQRVLAKRPADRPQSAEALLGELDAAAAAQLGTQTMLVAAPPRPRWLMPAAIGGTALVVALVAVLVGSSPSSSPGTPGIAAMTEPPPAPPPGVRIFFDAALVAQASRGKTPLIRKRAREVAEMLGLRKQVDWMGSHSLDLVQATSCRERRESVLALRSLGDPRAVPALKKARNRSGGFLGLQAVNSCLRDDADQAIAELEAKL